MDAQSTEHVLSEEQALELWRAVTKWRPWLMRRPRFREFTDDILSESFIRLYLNIGHMKDGCVDVFARGIVRFVAFEEARKQTRLVPLNPTHTVSSKINPWLSDIKARIDELNPDWRREMCLAYFGGYTPQEITKSKQGRRSIVNFKQRAIQDLRLSLCRLR